jgi:hypothetical protein
MQATYAQLLFPEVRLDENDLMFLASQQTCYSPMSEQPVPEYNCMRPNNIRLGPVDSWLPTHNFEPITSPYQSQDKVWSWQCSGYSSPVSHMEVYYSPSPQQEEYEQEPVHIIKKRSSGGITKPRRTNREPRKLPEEATKVLHTWFNDHWDFPYPSVEEKEMLTNATGLSKTVRSFFEKDY